MIRGTFPRIGALLTTGEARPFRRAFAQISKDLTAFGTAGALGARIFPFFSYTPLTKDFRKNSAPSAPRIEIAAFFDEILTIGRRKRPGSMRLRSAPNPTDNTRRSLTLNSMDSGDRRGKL